ncbi:MAG: monooxygenase, partial [Pseudomonadota bacterium]
FIIGQAQSAFTVNFPHAMDEQAKHIAYIMQQCQGRNLARIEADRDAELAWVDEIVSLSRMNESYQAECTPGYYNSEGKPNPRSIKSSSYGAGSAAFFKRMAAWREDGTMQGLKLG